MLSRALMIATVTILIGCITAVGVRAQENLDRGKSPSQIFSGTCSACHKSPRGLLKNVSASSLPGFLRQHYTTGSEMASLLAGFLISNGAADPRYQQKDQSRQKDVRQDPRQDARPDQPDRFGRRQQPTAPATEASRSGPDGARPLGQGEGGRPGRDAKRQARPTAAPDANRSADGEAPVQAATDGKQRAKQKLGKRAKPAAEQPPKTDEAAPGAAKDEPSSDAAKIEGGKVEGSKSETARTNAEKRAADTVKPEGDRPEAAKPSGDATSKSPGEASKPAEASMPAEAKSDAAKSDSPKSDSTKSDAPKEGVGSNSGSSRPDPAPSVASPSSS